MPAPDAHAKRTPATGGVSLSSDALEDLAESVARHLQQQRLVPQMVSAKRLAGLLDVTVEWVYDHKDDLAAIRLGSGPNAPVRFNLTMTMQRLMEAQSAPTSRPGPKSRQSRRADAALLPIHGRASK